VKNVNEGDFDMANEENITQLIDHYLEGKLSPEMMTVVTRRLAEDAAFGEQVKAQQRIRAFFERKWEKDTMAQLNKLRAGLPAEAATREKEIFFRWKQKTGIYAIAASLALLILAGWFFSRPPAQPTLRNSVTYRIPLREEAANGLGFGADSTFVDSLTVAIIPAGKGPLRYQFQDTLTLFLTPAPTRNPRIQVTYNRSKELYTLVLNDTAYVLERGYAVVKPLQKAG
jgi:hypothetical protein